jgi:hypothetical protein
MGLWQAGDNKVPPTSHRPNRAFLDSLESVSCREVGKAPKLMPNRGHLANVGCPAITPQIPSRPHIIFHKHCGENGCYLSYYCSISESNRTGIRDGGGLSAASQFNDAITNCHGDRMNSVRGAHLADGGLNVLMNRSLLDLEDFADCEQF